MRVCLRSRTTLRREMLVASSYGACYTIGARPKSDWRAPTVGLRVCLACNACVIAYQAWSTKCYDCGALVDGMCVATFGTHGVLGNNIYVCVRGSKVNAWVEAITYHCCKHTPGQLSLFIIEGCQG